MSADRRFFASSSDLEVFKFTIDTTKTVVGASDGSENPYTFRIPCEAGKGNFFIVRVSDGRPDIAITPANRLSDMVLNFSQPGVYDVEIFGQVASFSFYGSTSGFAYGYDKLKITLIKRFSRSIYYAIRCFYGCSNLVIDIKTPFSMPQDSQYFFRGILKINSNLQLFDVAKVVQPKGMLQDITADLPGTLSAFWKSASNINLVYASNTFSSEVDKIEIISDSVETLSDPWGGVVFKNTGNIRLVCKTPNLKTVFRIHRNGQVRTRCHLGEVDVRSVTTTSGWANGGMATPLVDQTLLGWASNLPYMQAGVAWDWGGAKHSNNPAVIAAYNKITQQWGVIFQNLTMA